MKTTQGLGILASLVFVSCASVAHATVIDWSNTSGGDFNNGANWAGGTAPGASDTASFNTNADSSYTVSVSEDTRIHEVSVQNDDVVIDLNGNNLISQSSISVNGHTDSRLTLKNGVWDRERSEKATIWVASESGAKGSLALEGAWVNAHSALIGNEGEIVISDGSHLELSNGITLEKGGSIRVSGTLEGDNDDRGGVTIFDGEVVVEDGGSFYMNGFEHRTVINGDMSVLSNGDFYTGDLAISGNLEMDGMSSHVFAQDVTITGNVSVGFGTIFDAHSITVLSGGVLDQDRYGVLWMTGGPVVVDGGRYQASGAIEGHLMNVNHGTVSIGEEGIYTFAGGYDQDITSTLEITLGEEDLLGYDRLYLHEGDAVLDGTLKIDLWESFKPKLGDEFRLIFAGAGFEGMFSNFVLPELDTGLAWTWGIEEVESSEDGEERFSLKVVEGHSVPEPYTLVLMTIGLAGFAGARRFRKAV